MDFPFRISFALFVVVTEDRFHVFEEVTHKRGK
jgi:hypothetical protein